MRELASTPTQSPRPRDNPVRGAFYLLDGLNLLRLKGLRGYVAIPLTVNVVLFGAGLWWIWSQIGTIRAALGDLLPSWLEFLSVLLVPLFFLAALVFVLFFFSIIANFIAAPFNGLLAEAVERHLRSERGEIVEQPPLTWSDVIRDFAGSIGSELRKLGYFLPRAIVIGTIYFIPGLNIAAPFLWLVFSAWMLALSYADYPMGNHGLRFADQRRELRRWRLMSLGFGAAVAAAVLVPIANLVVMPAAVAGATKMWVERIAPYR